MHDMHYMAIAYVGLWCSSMYGMLLLLLLCAMDVPPSVVMHFIKDLSYVAGLHATARDKAKSLMCIRKAWQLALLMGVCERSTLKLTSDFTTRGACMSAHIFQAYLQDCLYTVT